MSGVLFFLLTPLHPSSATVNIYLVIEHALLLVLLRQVDNYVLIIALFVLSPNHFPPTLFTQFLLLCKVSLGAVCKNFSCKIASNHSWVNQGLNMVGRGHIQQRNP
jgi:hypothetical protein